MDGDSRRKKLTRILTDSSKAVSGTDLARQLGVSRQVIVQDIALLRATNKNIISTNKGYTIYNPATTEHLFRRTFSVNHTDEQIADELYTIVDFGGTILDCVIEHAVYGQISVDLMLHDRKEIDEYLADMKKTRALPLKTLTDDHHFHTVEANSEALLDIIESKLSEKNFLNCSVN